MSKPAKLLVGAATLWPPVYLFLFFAGWVFLAFQMSLYPGHAVQLPDGFFLGVFVVHGITTLWIWGLMAVYIYEVFNNRRVDAEKKALWAVVLFLGGLIAMPIYWYLYLWCDEPLEPLSPDQRNRRLIPVLLACFGLCFAVGLVLFVVTLGFGLLWVEQGRIHQAVRGGDVAEVQRLLRVSPELLEARNNQGLTPLLDAAYDGKVEVAKLLIRQGAHVNANWGNLGEGYNPLHAAAIYGHVEVAKLLIQSGTNINARATKGDTPLDVAIRNGHEALAAVLKANGGVKGRGGP